MHERGSSARVPTRGSEVAGREAFLDKGLFRRAGLVRFGRSGGSAPVFCMTNSGTSLFLSAC